jgi:hypothetical protein
MRPNSGGSTPTLGSITSIFLVNLFCEQKYLLVPRISFSEMRFQMPKICFEAAELISMSEGNRNRVKTPHCENCHILEKLNILILGAPH